MYVNHSGWNENTGPFSYDIFIDENKTDYEIHYEDGSVARQNGPFQSVTADWNCDGYRREQFGAWFDMDGRGEFLTPENLVCMLLNDDYCGPKAVKIPGINIPSPDKRPTLDETILAGEKRAASLKTDKKPPHKSHTNSPETPER